MALVVSYKPAGVFYCEKCKIVHREKERADECCQTEFKCPKCGGKTNDRYMMCSACWFKQSDEKEKARFDKAEKIADLDYGGWIFSDGHGHNNGYFPNVEELKDYLEGEVAPEERPEYAWACKSKMFVQLDTDRIVQRFAEMDDAYEDFDEGRIVMPPEFLVGIDKFNEANKGIVSYAPDYSRAVLLK